jgi:cystathionine beta-lyase/cystathionine gamma-synthase
MSHSSIPAEMRARRGFAEDLVRLSVGIEDVEDIAADLRQALAASGVPAAIANGAG